MDEIKHCDALILAGGLGTRLRSEVGGVQKTMADVGGKPFMDIILQHLVAQGFKRVIICTGYQAESVEAYYRSKDFGVQIDFSQEKEKLGTGGAVKNAAALVESDSFFVLNGDSFCPVNFEAFLNFHQSKQSLVSIAISQVNNIDDYGSILVDEITGKIAFFGEKMKAQDVEAKDQKIFVNNGVYCFQKSVFQKMPAEEKFSMEKDFFQNLPGSDFYGFEVEESFLDIGVPERYEEAKKKYIDKE